MPVWPGLTADTEPPEVTPSAPTTPTVHSPPPTQDDHGPGCPSQYSQCGLPHILGGSLDSSSDGHHIRVSGRVVYKHIGSDSTSVVGVIGGSTVVSRIRVT